MKRVNNIYVSWQEVLGRIEGLQTSAINRIHIEREIIPIIFVPGIMGSRLRRQENDTKIWDPDDDKFMVSRYGWKTLTAARRRALLIGSDFDRKYAAVDNNDTEHNKMFSTRQDRSRDKRGWGGVMWGSYGSFLVQLQQHQWPNPVSFCFEFPVHAFGYNWTQSNRNSGSALARYIKETICTYQNGTYNPYGRKRICKKVILVTHSMGGLVARSACVLYDAKDHVLGVIHGVQPATGSPSAYWRMKAGFERPRGGPKKEVWDWLRNPLKMTKHQFVGRTSAVVLGTNGEEVTSLLGNCPGGLELLPTKEYRDNAGRKAWLEYPGRHGNTLLPSTDPYEEIYLLKDVVYRMVDPSWLNPTQKKKQGKKDPWDLYSGYVRQAQSFHEDINKDPDNSFHPQTYQFYGTDLDSCDSVGFVREEVLSGVDCRTGGEMKFLNKGSFTAYVNAWEYAVRDRGQAIAKVKLKPPAGKGDGTVPLSSASMLPVGEGRTAQIGTDEEAWFDIGHQDILGSSRARQLTFAWITDLTRKYIDAELEKLPSENRQ